MCYKELIEYLEKELRAGRRDFDALYPITLSWPEGVPESVTVVVLPLPPDVDVEDTGNGSNVDGGPTIDVDGERLYDIPYPKDGGGRVMVTYATRDDLIRAMIATAQIRQHLDEFLPSRERTDTDTDDADVALQDLLALLALH
ncbi:MAG: hypothetical protein ABIG63_04675 [Chloroflexota bacterium]